MHFVLCLVSDDFSFSTILDNRGVKEVGELEAEIAMGLTLTLVSGA